MPTDPRPIASANRLALGMAASVIAGALIARGLARAMDWKGVDAGFTVEESVVAGAAAVGFGALIGLSLLWPPSSRTAPKFGLMVLAASTTRMLVSLTALVTLLFAAKPAIYPLVASLCSGFLICLVVESYWALAALRRVQPGRESSTPSLHSGAIVR